LDEFENEKISPIFSNPVGEHRRPSPFRTTMAENRGKHHQHMPAASENQPLIRRGFANKAIPAGPPPW
jgi:hypothetical protein